MVQHEKSPQKKDLLDLLTFVLRFTYFQYNGSIYEQKDGAAMGSPVSAVIANLYMENFEEQAITNHPTSLGSGNATWTIPLPSWIAKT